MNQHQAHTLPETLHAKWQRVKLLVSRTLNDCLAQHLVAEAVKVFEEMVRVSKASVVISLPDAERVWRYSIYLPKYGNLNFLLPRPTLFKQENAFDGEHYWEINKKGFELKKNYILLVQVH